MPASARSKPLLIGRLTTARISPVAASSATRAAGCALPAKVLSAAVCTAGSRVVVTGCGGEPSKWSRVATTLPALSTIWMSAVGLPASWRSKAPSSPERPTTVPVA